MGKVANNLVIFTKTKTLSKNPCGDLAFLSLSFVKIGRQQYTVYRVSTQTTPLPKLKTRLPRSPGHIAVRHLKQITLMGAKGAHTKARSLPQFNWVPRSQRQLLKIILLLLKTKLLAPKLQWRSRHTPFLISGGKRGESINVGCLTQTLKKTTKTY